MISATTWMRPLFSVRAFAEATSPRHSRSATRHVEHDMDDQALNIDKRTTRTAGDVGKFFARDRCARSVERGNKQNGRVEVEALGQSRRRNNHLENAFGQQDLELAEERAWQAPMVDRDADLQAGDRGMFFAKPFAADFQSAGDRASSSRSESR